MPYPNYINYISSNEKVISSVVNRPSRELALRTESLKKRLDTADLGQAIILYDAPLVKDAVVGSPVYWNEDNKQFELAVAEAELDTGYLEYVKTERANCIGLVYEKESSTSGSIVLSGVVDLTGISSLFDETGSGRFYLGATAGKLTHKLLGVCVPLGTIIGKYGDCDGVYRVCVNPVLNDLWSHLHYAVDLVPKCIGPDATEEGWQLIGSGGITDANAPADAVYKYKIMPGTVLSKLFPPIPIDACSIVIDWNDLDETIGSKEIPLNCNNDIARVTIDGIYWTDTVIKPFPPSVAFEVEISDKTSSATWAEGDTVTIDQYTHTLPAPTSPATTFTNVEVAQQLAAKATAIGWTITVEKDSSGNDTSTLLLQKGTPTSPYFTEAILVDTSNNGKKLDLLRDPRMMREKLYMSKTQFANTLNCVTSLRPYTNHPFRFVNCRGEESYAGDLWAQFTLAEDPVEIKDYDGMTMRRFNDEYKQELTPVVNGISVSGDTITATSNVTKVIDETTYCLGLTNIDISPLNNSEISPQIMKLGDALEREYNGIMYVGFPRDRESSILAKFEIPGTFSGYVKFSTLFYTSIAGEYPSITCQYKIIHKPSDSIALNTIYYNPLYWNTGETQGTTVRTVTANSAFNLCTYCVPIVAGDTLVLKLTRTTSAVTYAGDAGIIRINGILNKEGDQ